MKIKIIKNTTGWNTKDLSRFIRAVVSYLERMEKRLNIKVRVSISHNRTGTCYASGRAVIGGSFVWLRFPKVENGFNKVSIANLIYHEFQHIIGYRHGEIPGSPRGVYRCKERFEQFEKYPVRPKEIKVKSVNVQQIRYDRTLMAVAKWQRKLKLARTKLAQYNRKVKYYEKAVQLKAVAAAEEK